MQNAIKFRPKSPTSSYQRQSYHPSVVQYFDKLADNFEKWSKKTAFNVNHVIDLLQSTIPSGKKILLFGCLSPRIPEALNPALCVVAEVSQKMTEALSRNSQNPNVSYVCSAPESFQSKEKFDYIISLSQSDYADDLSVLTESIKRLAHPDTKIILSMVNPIWHPVLRFVSFVGIRMPDFKRNLISQDALTTILEIKNFHVKQSFRRLLIPRNIPLLSSFTNRFIARLPWINSLCLIQYLVLQIRPALEKQSLSCSVIVPCFNEEGNVEECALRVPIMGKFTEVIVVDDGSTDRTLALARELEAKFKHIRAVAMLQNGGKGSAVMAGIRAAKGDVVMILDADMTVPPEELVDFFEAIEVGAADFVSGTRFVYPMENEAMRFANYLGNVLFSKLVEIVIGSPCTDTLCGTKVMRRKDFLDMRLEDSRWGDFDFIFHAAKLKLRSLQIPVHYKQRMAGTSKMKAFTAGVRFLALVFRKWKALP